MSERIVFDWPDVGKLEIITNYDSAVLRYSVAESVIMKRAEEFSKPSQTDFQNEHKTNHFKSETLSTGRSTSQNNDNDSRFKSLSQKAQTDIRNGSFEEYIVDLTVMADFFISEKKYVDALKVLMIAFYYLLSGVYGDRRKIERMISETSKLSCMTGSDIENLYRNTIRKDILPYQTVSISESCFKFLELCKFSSY